MVKIRTKARHIVGVIIALLIILADILYFTYTPYFTPIIIIAVTVAWLQYWMDFFMENARQKEIEEIFPDYVRNLVSAIKSGMPISRAVMHVADTDYGSLTPYIKKLAYQVEWGVPVHKALLLFGDSTGNNVIKRAVTTVIEAELSGGNLEDVLDSVTNSLVEIKKIKDQRMAAVHSQVVQNYIIFFVFLGVIIVIQNMLIPYVMQLQGSTATGDLLSLPAPTITQKASVSFASLTIFVQSLSDWFISLNGVFLMLALIQGFFAGLVIGKLSEGNLKYGLKHSLILVTVAFFAISLAQGF